MNPTPGLRYPLPSTRYPGFWFVIFLVAGCARTAQFRPHPPVAVPPPGLGAAAPSPVLAEPPPLPPATRLILGERMTYTITWFGLAVLRGELRVIPGTQDGRAGVEIRGTAQGAGIVQPIFKIQDRASAWVDPQTLQPSRSELVLRHRFRHVTETVTYDSVNGRAISAGERTTPVEIPVTTETRDFLSACYALRASDLQEGRRLELAMIADGKRWTVAAIPRRRGTLTMSQGTFPVLEVEMQSTWLKQYIGRESLWVWVTTDATRTPLMARITIPFVGPLTALLDDRLPAWPPAAPEPHRDGAGPAPYRDGAGPEPPAR